MCVAARFAAVGVEFVLVVAVSAAAFFTEPSFAGGGNSRGGPSSLTGASRRTMGGALSPRAPGAPAAARAQEDRKRAAHSRITSPTPEVWIPFLARTARQVAPAKQGSLAGSVGRFVPRAGGHIADFGGTCKRDVCA